MRNDIVLVLVALLVCRLPADGDVCAILRAARRAGANAVSAVAHGVRNRDEYSSAEDWRWLLLGPPHRPVIRPPSRTSRLEAAVAGRQPRLLSDSTGPRWFRSPATGAPLSPQELLDVLGQLNHPVACQEQAGGSAFMYYDKDAAANDGLMRDEPLVAPIVVDEPATSGPSGLGDGGRVGGVGATLGQWILRTMATEQPSDLLSGLKPARVGNALLHGSRDPAVLYCVEELSFEWGRWPDNRGQRDMPPRSALSAALAPFLPSLRAAIAVDRPQPHAPSGHQGESQGDRSETTEDVGEVGEPVVNVWMHGAGAATQLHYDVMHNVLVQVAGTKTVLLLPPADAPCVHLFPTLHPRHRKSQVPSHARSRLSDNKSKHSGGEGAAHEGDSDQVKDAKRSRRWLAPAFLAFIRNGTWPLAATPMGGFSAAERKFSEFSTYLATGACSGRSGAASWWPSRWLAAGGEGARPRPYLVTLQPGDALYIPPLWLHAVESPNFSMSVNTFSPSAEARALEAALFGTPLPFEAHWAGRVTARAAVVYLGLVGAHLGLSLPDTARDLLSSRFAVPREIRAAGNHSAELRRGSTDEAFAVDSSMEQVPAQAGDNVDGGGGSNIDGDGGNGDSDSGGGDGVEEWLPWCREPSLDTWLLAASSAPKKAGGKDAGKFKRAALAHAHALALVGAAAAPKPALPPPASSNKHQPSSRAGAVRLAFEELVQVVVGHFFGPGLDGLPLFLCACLSPAPTRDVTRDVLRRTKGKETRSAHARLASCARQWDSRVHMDKA